MTTASRPAGRTAPRTPAADVLAELTAVLAGMVGVEADAVDAELPFPLLGLDSLLGVEFLRALGARYGTSIGNEALADHPTPAALARHVAGLLGAAPSAPPAPVRTPAPRDDRVLGALRTQLARILRCAPGDLEDRAPFTVLGLDSVLAAEFVAGINRTWGLTEQAALLYDHPDLAAMADHLTERLTGTAAAVPAPERAGEREPAGERDTREPAGTREPARARAATVRPAPAALDLDALLDAVRDDVLSVDEAAALLAARSA